MRPDSVALGDVIDGLVASHKMTHEDAQHARLLLQKKKVVQPWYVRTMVGFGAWLASFFVIGFFTGVFAGMGSVGFIVIGLMLVAGAVSLRRVFTSDFMVQCALAGSLAGQAMAAFGLIDAMEWREIEVFCWAVIVMSTVLFVIFPDRIHRVVSVLLATGSLLVFIYAKELNALVPVVGPALAVAFVALHEHEGSLVERGHGALLRPLQNGLMLGAFGCLLLSTVYLLPELGSYFDFYPRPWISTILLGALFLYVGYRVWPPLVTKSQQYGLVLVYGLMSIVIAAAWLAPGLLLALIVVMIGAASGNRSTTGAGVAFLVVFVAAYFYGIEITMLEKAGTLVASGIAILLARWALLKVMAGSPAAETSND